MKIEKIELYQLSTMNKQAMDIQPILDKINEIIKEINNAV